MGWRTFFPGRGAFSRYFGCFRLRGESFGLVLCEVTVPPIFTEFDIEIHHCLFVTLPIFAKYS
jgi:hypothetical protein